MTSTSIPATGSAVAGVSRRAWAGPRPGVWLAAALVLAFLLMFLLLPVGRVFYTAFVESDGTFTLGHFSAFFSQGLMRESFFNSLYVAVLSTVAQLMLEGAGQAA